MNVRVCGGGVCMSEYGMRMHAHECATRVFASSVSLQCAIGTYSVVLMHVRVHVHGAYICVYVCRCYVCVCMCVCARVMHICIQVCDRGAYSGQSSLNSSACACACACASVFMQECVLVHRRARKSVRKINALVRMISLT